ncbi:uncharacterized protein LOC113316884 isoform X2 [Papaver somniferum]|uniref:uncharacterized protein LOC113316884 isoform X2 n=1 Tax=Papaver somniferum TaxID=3469 RepID=UPI000E6F9064|nr:uncharacterized protein LOC113316884 isoform X2 [Papaver somniferum]
MPGTIQVSVFDLLDFPSSSSSTISIKVSMGKREFRTWDKGDFSFPLTTLRDNIIVTIHDAEGKELSRTGVATMSVVEKGILDDFFVLEGGGRLHMKLQFILNSVERKRIQELREIALKKKQEEILIDRVRHSEAAALARFRSNVGSSSMSLNHEVTESLVQKEAESSGAEFLRNADNRIKDPSDSLNEDGVLAAQLAHPDPKSASIIKNPLQTPSSRIKDSIPGIEDSQEILLDRSEEPIRSVIDGGDDLSKVLLTEEPQFHHAKAEKQDIDKINTQVPPVEVPTSSGEGTLSTVLLSEKLHIHQKVIDKIETPLTSVDIPTNSSEGITLSTVLVSEELQIPYGKSDEKVVDESETRIPSIVIPTSPSLSTKYLGPDAKEVSESLIMGENHIVKSTGAQLTWSGTLMGAVSSLEALDTHSVDHSVSDTIEVDRDLNESKSMLPPNDIPARPISSPEELESRSSEDSVSSKFEEARILNEDKTPGSPTDIPLRRISSLVELNSHPGNYSISPKSEVERSLNNNETLIPPTDTPVRLTSSFKDLGNHLNSSKFGEVQMLNKTKMLVATTDVSMRRVSSHGNFGDHSRSSKFEEDRLVSPEKPSVTKRMPSNVRKMISAFETSQAKGQVTRVDPPIIRTQPMKSKFNISPAEPTVKEVMKDMNYIRERKDGGLEQNGKEARHAYETSQEESKNTMRETHNTGIAAETGSRLSSAVKTQERNLQESASEIRQRIPVSLEQDGRDKLCEQGPSQEQLIEATTSPSHMPAATKLLETDQHPNIASQLRTCVQHIEKLILVEPGCDKTQLPEDYRAKKYPVGNSGSCILTDESRPLCITTGTKQLMNLVGGSSNFSEIDQGENSSYQTDITNENLHHNICGEVQKLGKASDDTRKSNLEGPQNVIEGLIGQAGKVAAIVAFGALVIFARER